MKIHVALVGCLFMLTATVNAETKTYQYPQAAPLPEDSILNMMRDPTLINGFDTNLTAERFAQAWFSKNNERERIKADMYLLGVLDTTEGKTWCGYNRLLPSSIHEKLYASFENLSADKAKLRASKVISDAMTKFMPCDKGSKK